MANATLRPNADVAANWYLPSSPTTHESQIDEVVSFPTTPNNDNIFADGWLGGDDNQYDQFSFPDPTGVDTVTNLTICVHGQIDNQGTTNYPELSWYNGSAWSGDYECSNFPKNDTFHIAANGDWVVISLPVSLTQAQINALQIRIRADVPDGSKTVLACNTVYCLYVSIVYTESGYGHDFIGVPAANIGSANGVPTANIASIKGV